MKNENVQSLVINTEKGQKGLLPIESKLTSSVLHPGLNDLKNPGLMLET